MAQSLEKGQYRLKQAYIPNSSFNINGTNNRIPFFESGANKVAVLTPGFYGESELLDAIAAGMTAASGAATYSVTVSTIPHRIIISSTIAFQLMFGSDQVTTASEVIGFTNANTGFNTVQTANNVSNLAELRSYNIVLHGASSAFRDLNGTSYTFCIPIVDNTLGITMYEPTAHFPQTVEFSSIIQTLEISIRDSKGNIIDLTTDWHLILENCHHGGSY
jgi:hypothetical protein